MGDISDTTEIDGNKPNGAEKARKLSRSPTSILNDRSAGLRTNLDFGPDKS